MPTDRRPADPSEEPLRIRRRAFILGLLAVPVFVVWTLVTEEIYVGHLPTVVSIFFHCVAGLVLLIWVNGFLQRRAPRWALNRPELLLVYSMTSVASAVAGFDWQMLYVRSWIYPFYRALNDPAWQITNLLPWNKHLTVTDPRALQRLFEGHSSLYLPEHLHLWVGIFLFLGAMLACIQVLGLGISVIFLRQWADSERLTFPVAQLPLDLTSEKVPLWRSRLFWIALAVVFTIDIVNGIHQFIPTVPALPIKRTTPLVGLLPSGPWRRVQSTMFSTFPFMIGLAFLLPTDLSLSCAVFYILSQLQVVATAAMGIDPGFPYSTKPQAPYLVEQGIGAMWALFIALILRARPHLRSVWRSATGREKNAADGALYRRALIALAAGSGGMLCLLRLVGMSWGGAGVAIAAYLVMVTVVCRIRAELGPPMYDLHYAGADRVLAMFAGPANLSRGDWLGIGFLFGFNRGMRNLSLPHETEGLYAIRKAGGQWDRAVLAIGAAGVLASFLSVWGILHLGYARGFNNMVQPYCSEEVWSRIRPWLDAAPGPQWSGIGATGCGALVAGALLWCRHHFFGFPLHAAGYALACNWAMNVTWFPMLLAWAMKSLVLRYRGRAGYQAALPLFLGMILADFLAGTIWSLVSVFTGVETYSTTW